MASLRYELISLIIKPLAGVVRGGSSLFQVRVGRNHLPRDEIMADAEMRSSER